MTDRLISTSVSQLAVSPLQPYVCTNSLLFMARTIGQDYLEICHFIYFHTIYNKP